MNNTQVAGMLLSAIFYLLFMTIIGPFLTIWSLNTLFGFEIAFTFKNWMAVVWLSLIINGLKFNTNKNE